MNDLSNAQLYVNIDMVNTHPNERINKFNIKLEVNLISQLSKKYKRNFNAIYTKLIHILLETV